jgi:hypothetical protein
LWSFDVEGRRRRCVELGGRAIRARMERVDARTGTVVWRRCSRAAFIGRERPEVGGRGVTGGGSVELQWRSRFGWGRKWGGETGSWGEERSNGADSFCRGRGRGAARGEEPAVAPGRASGGRRRPGSLIGWAHLLVRGGDGQTGP